MDQNNLTKNSRSITNTYNDIYAYPKIIDSLNLRELYDSTKWYFYLLDYKDTPKFFNTNEYKSNKPVPLSFLELEFDSVIINGDSVAIMFHYRIDYEKYKDSDTIIMDYGTDCGLLFYPEIMGSLKICSIGGIDKLLSCFEAKNQQTYDTTTYRILKPLQPDVIQFLNEHKDKIHPWLYHAALKRGIIKE